MARAEQLDLSRPPERWRPAAMPGASHDLSTIPLASVSAPFSVLGRFPVGFVRSTPGGYLVAEEFVVLSGALWLDGRRLGPGMLVHVGAGRLREELRTPDGCLALVWFDGPPHFVPAAELPTVPDAPCHVVDLADLRDDRLADAPGGTATEAPLLVTSVSRWTRGAAAQWPARADGFDARRWAAGASAWQGTAEDLVIWRAAASAPAPEGARS
ncbi:hypothetical protein [Nocardioides gansuensis]|uniref:hypothetical protein n=1 Tax=Nocardioides gansuensis TaxID=2138300 RepID=UPI0014036F2F|nr:hypothetical protein [Nocardioides gansuensis]